MVGISMAVTIFLCIAAFIWIYVRIGPAFSDFVPANSAAATPSATPSTLTAASPVAGTPTATIEVAVVQTSTPSASPTPVWQATHQVRNEGQAINFRSQPGTASSVVTVLEGGTRLMFIGEQQSVGGSTWMHFMLQNGSLGWIRSIDVTTLNP